MATFLATGCMPGPGLLGPHRHFAHPSGAQPPTQGAEVEACALLRTAQQAEQIQRTDEALAAGNTLLQKFAATEAAAQWQHHRSHELLKRGDDSAAVQALEHVLFHRPQFSSIAEVRSEYAVLLVRVNRVQDALALWRTLGHNNAKDGQLAVGQQLLRPLVDSGAGRSALELMVDLASSAEISAQQQERLFVWGKDVAATLLSTDDATALWDAHKGQQAWAFVIPTLGFRLAKIHYHVGDHQHAEQLLAQVQRYPTSEDLAAQIRAFSALMQSRFEVDNQTVGVLLPLSGRFQQFGERSLAAIRLAMANTPRIRLVVKDTQGEANAASQAIDSLVFEHHAIAAIGPLFSGEAAAAAAKAEELGLPLITLSHREGLPKMGSFVFRSALTVAAQAQALAKTAMETLGLTKFAVMYPRSRYGVDFAQAFWDEIDRRHGQIRGIESYEPEQTTFREPIRRLVGRWYLNARPEFHAGLEELKERNLSGMRMRSEVERLDKRTRPIVDFEALVIPDSGRQLGLIAPSVAFEDVILTRDPKSLDKIRRALGQPDSLPITLLGASTWNSAQTLEGCEQYCEDAVFVDAFFAGSTDIRVRDFVAAYTQAAGSEPLLSEAQAYDTAAWLAFVLAPATLGDRPQLRDALLAGKTYVGVCGPMHFDALGEAQKELTTLTIRNHTIVPYSAKAGPTSKTRRFN